MVRRRVALVALLLVALAVGWGLGWWTAGSSERTLPYEGHRGVWQGTDDQGRGCIERADGDEVCAVLRLAPGAPPLPEVGSPARGGLTELPRDSSDLPEPTWVYVSPLACGWEGTGHATVCP